MADTAEKAAEEVLRCISQREDGSIHAYNFRKDLADIFERHDAELRGEIKRLKSENKIIKKSAEVAIKIGEDFKQQLTEADGPCETCGGTGLICPNGKPVLGVMRPEACPDCADATNHAEGGERIK